MSKFVYDLPEIELKFKNSGLLKEKVSNSDDAYQIFLKIFDADTIEFYESFFSLFLNNSNKTIGFLKVSQGGFNGTVVDPRLILSTALKCAASKLIIAHNHPSGNLNPSEQDKMLTTKLKNACSFLDINLIDHIVITKDGFLSFADEGLL